MTFLRKLLVVFVNLSLVWATIPDVALALPVPGRAPHAFQEVYAPVAARDLAALVAPIALYPDALVAQILGAATYPDQVVDADAYVKANPNLTGDALVNSVDEKQWDPSVMALMQFASVLDKLANNLPWTSALGDAAANQQAEVAAAVQRMRAKAYSAGNLKSGEQIKVVQQSPDVIVIQPANPQVVYVPTYNPTVVYGTPVTTPGYTTGDVVAASIISFSVGIAVGAAIGGSSCGWHYSSWGMHWSTRSVYCGGGMYYGNPYWWGGYYPGYYPGYRPPYYPPPRPPRPPPPGWRPPPSGVRPRPTPLPQPVPGRPGRPGTMPVQPGRPDRPTTMPVQPGRPDRPSTQPARPGGPTTLPAPSPTNPGNGNRPGGGGPSTRPAPGTPSPQPNTRELRGYPATAKPQPAKQPNAFSGSGGGRPQSARGNQSLQAPTPRPAAPAARPAGGGARR